MKESLKTGALQSLVAALALCFTGSAFADSNQNLQASASMLGGISQERNLEAASRSAYSGQRTLMGAKPSLTVSGTSETASSDAWKRYQEITAGEYAKEEKGLKTGSVPAPKFQNEDEDENTAWEKTKDVLTGVAVAAPTVIGAVGGAVVGAGMGGPVGGVVGGVAGAAAGVAVTVVGALAIVGYSFIKAIRDHWGW